MRRSGAVWIWTLAVRGLMAVAERAGIEMACMGGTTRDRSDDVRIANLPDAVRDNPESAAVPGARDVRTAHNRRNPPRHAVC